MNNPWKQKNSKVVYENPWLSVREDAVVRPDGSDGIYGVVSMKVSGGYIVALNEDGQVPLVKLFRYPTQDATWEFPSGGVDKNDPEAGVKTELVEETGFAANRWVRIGGFYSMAGVGDEFVHVFLARELSDVGNDKQSNEGITEVHWVNFEDVAVMIRNGEFLDGPSIAAYFLAKDYLQNEA
ncbi:MAG: NUDIX hydrolase [Planctomycetaceae bacterium]|nr:NUDIX hydrolase [Planctomycetaceae bacterium]